MKIFLLTSCILFYKTTDLHMTLQQINVVSNDASRIIQNALRIILLTICASTHLHHFLVVPLMTVPVTHSV